MSKEINPERKTRSKRPHVWKSGPDIKSHEQYQAWLVHKAQANFRGEPHELAFEDFRELWNQDDRWCNRGRGSDNICMHRVNTELAWSKDNVVFEMRKDYLKRVNHSKRGTKYKQG